ncbi:MAG: hypothetical protein AAF609_11640 [Cyanobacteria bacterium P01_C01_bin.120]
MKLQWNLHSGAIARSLDQLLKAALDQLDKFLDDENCLQVPA